MSTMRELVYFSIAHGDLDHDPDHETGSDRIAALARSDPLGAALWRLMGSLDVSSLRQAAILLAAKLSMRQGDALMAVEQWLANQTPFNAAARKVLVESELLARRQMERQLGRRPDRSSRGKM